MTSAFLFINAELLFVEDVINKLKEIPELWKFLKVQGIYDIIARANSDIIARANSDTEEKLKDSFQNVVGKLLETGTVTVIIAREIKSTD